MLNLLYVYIPHRISHMKAQIIQHYDAPHQFEPLMPGDTAMGPLLERAADLSRAAAQLAVEAGTGGRRELRDLLRRMNSYYTNQIEGEHTRPSDIDRALQNDYSSNLDLARKQRLAVAHIETEQAAEKQLAQGSWPDGAALDLYTTKAIQWMHHSLFAPLSDQDRALSDGNLLTPGLLRQTQVAVGRHEAPLWSAVPAFLSKWGDTYGRVRRGEAALIAAAASHHRLAWVHPFADGNGRVTRLHTHLVLAQMGLTNGLWSPLRGFARTSERYKALLQAADEHRRGDLDGRGNLTQAGLVDWVHYVLDTCMDQVSFMSARLNVGNMKDRIYTALLQEELKKTGVKTASLLPLHYLFATQTALSRAEFKAMTGMGDRVGSGQISALLKRGFLSTDSAYGALQFAIPMHALSAYFPALWPEAEADQA
jgi:Fic family protein